MFLSKAPNPPRGSLWYLKAKGILRLQNQENQKKSVSLKSSNPLLLFFIVNHTFAMPPLCLRYASVLSPFLRNGPETESYLCYVDGGDSGCIF